MLLTSYLLLNHTRLSHIRPHPLIIQIFGFANITDIDLHLTNFVIVLDTEIIPIAMSLRVRVTPNETIILVGCDSDGKVKVGGLELCVELVLRVLVLT